MGMGATETIKQIEKIKKALSASDHQTLLKAEYLLLRQRLQTMCRELLLTNLETALDKKVESDVWNFAFKSQITAFQMATKSSNNTTRKAEFQAHLNLFLEGALGFYMQLLEDVCEAFRIHPSFRRKFSAFGIIQERRVTVSRRQQGPPPSSRSSLYICQYCLVHLGDVARYLNRMSLAQNFYHLAVKLVPSVGQPYNQLAIIMASRSQKISVTYYSIQSIAVRTPFPVAPTNLEKMHVKQIKEAEAANYLSRNKWSHGDLINTYLYLQAVVHTEAGLEKAQEISDILTKCMAASSIFSLLSERDIFQMAVITIFTCTQMEDLGAEPGDDSPSYHQLILSFTVSLLEIYLTHAPKYNVREHITLPAIKVLLDWLVYKEQYLSTNVIKCHSVWAALSKALNAIQSHCKDPASLDLSSLAGTPLPEEVELQCFVPMTEAHSSLNFEGSLYEKMDLADAVRLRCYRLVELGTKFVGKYPSLNLLDYKVNAKNSRLIFSAMSISKVDSSSKPRTAKQNVAIQAIKSRDSPVMMTKDTDLVSENLLPTETPSWTAEPEPVGWESSVPNAFALGHNTLLAQHGAVPGFSHSFSNELNQMPATSNFAQSLLMDSLSGRPIRTPLTSVRPPPGFPGTQGAIGSEKKLSSHNIKDLLDKTSSIDPILPHPMANLSASDSSVFTQRTDSYRLFPFDEHVNPSMSLNRAPGQGLMEVFSSDSHSLGWPNQIPNNPVQHSTNQSANIWGMEGSGANRFSPSRDTKPPADS